MIYRKIRFQKYRVFRTFSIIINRLRFSLYGIKHGLNLRVSGLPYLLLHPTARVEIGDDFEFTNGNGANALTRNIRGCIRVERNAIVEIGNNVGISSGVIWAKSSIKIGSNVKIGAGSILLDTDCHSLDWKIRSSILKDSYDAKSSPIEIGDDVLIGYGCVILKGVKIGNRSIIGAGSVVTRDIPSDVIAAGNPCKVIREI